MERATAVAHQRSALAARSPFRRLGRFVLERFPPGAYGTLIVALVLCGTAGATLDEGGTFGVGLAQAWAVVAAWLAFLQLRVLDELRDEAADRIGRPERPLPRGLVARQELRALAVVAAIAGIGAASVLGLVAFAWYGLAVAQIWLLDVLDDRRPTATRGMVPTALIHSGIVPAVLLFAWVATASLDPGPTLAATVVLAWGAGLALEVGRKTLSIDEERPGIATYSAALGRPRALALAAGFVAVTGAGSALLAASVGAPGAIVILPLGVVAIVSLVLIAGNDGVATGALRGGIPLIVLAALLWPVLLAWGLP